MSAGCQNHPLPATEPRVEPPCAGRRPSAASLIGRPLLVVHSQGDRFVSVDDAVAIAGAAAAECWITDSEGHIGSFPSAPAVYIERVVSFFAQHLAGNKAT